MSESPVVKLRKRLSLKHYASDSPKTPKNKNKTVYSTPINRKRCAFDEESPSQDAFSSPIPFSQDVANRVETDVTWEWNSPKRQNLSDISKRKPKTKLCLPGNKLVKEKIIKKSDFVSEAAERGGFFKFEEELKNICLSNTKPAEGGVHVEEDVIMETSEKIKNSNEENLCGNYSNFFNDSDFDSIIMQCNEDKDPAPVTKDLTKNGCEITKNSSTAASSFSRVTSLPTKNVTDKSQAFQRTVTMPSKSNTYKSDSSNFSGESSVVTSPSKSQKDENRYLQAFLDDSDDFDCILMQCSQKVEEEFKQSQNSVSNQYKSKNDKSFLRHNSMPGSPSIKKVDRDLGKPTTTQNKCFQRTISMPTRAGNFKASSNSISSTASSSSNSVNRCTLEEIEAKRQKALKLKEKKRLEK